MLHIGTLERQTAATNLNTRSSRSHTLFTLLVNTREITSGGEELIKTGKLHLVDLAGSENIGRSGATDVRAREAGTINKSLLTLGKVIKALAQKLQHIPYRDSKLTRILQDSLGGNTKTCMIGTISPGINAWDETVSTLDYANVARNVANCPQVNVNRKQANFLKELQDEISKLRHELLAARNGEGFYVSVETYEKMAQDIEKNQERILELIRQIRDLEEYKLTREHQYHELNESFKQTKLYLETTGKELEKKKNKVKQNEFILSYMRERDEELSEKANVLLKVCETSTKHEEIYHSKYEGQCNATLSNANLANSILSSSVNYLKEVQNVSNIHLNDQEMYRSEVKRSLQSLEENHTRDLEQIAQLSSEMQEQTDNHEGLCFEKIFKNDTTEYSENNIKNYFNSVYDNNLVQLTNHSKFKNSLEMLKDHTLTKTAEMKLKSTHCLNSVSVKSFHYVITFFLIVFYF
ncbi:Kinesin domain containing protein [Asbolus verrucosus]|uniref:Kinesin-like protein n=1 Tax=Asbolus verrucosus TaxID=1661398 RepID=A0A482W7T7_ASBVE|nr:Kinesin domain containing protein [Asbolus verrucosus]